MPKKNSKISRICPNCNEEYWVYPSEYNKRNFCSMKCKKEYNWEDRICEYCGDVFHVRKSSKVKFCSTKCSRTAIYERGLETRICRNCGKEFDVLKSSDNLCCCDECYIEWKSKHEKVHCTCDYCGKEMVMSKIRFDNNVRGHYCSQECSQKSQIRGKYVECKNCGKLIYKMESLLRENNFCSKECVSEYNHKNNSTTKECEMCGKVFEIKNSKVDTARFCSNECKNKWQSEFRVGENSPTWKGGLLDYNCDYCGTLIKIKPHRLNISVNHFCSYDCRDKFYSIPKNRTEKQKIADEYLAKNAIKHIKPYFSKPHKLISQYLESQDIPHENEKLAHYYKLDIYLTDKNLIIEINGDFWHCSPIRFKEIKYPQQLKTIYKDKSKDTYIKNKFEHNILYLWEADIIKNYELCQRLIDLYIENDGVLSDYNSFNYELVNNKAQLKKDIIVPYQCMKKEELKKYVTIDKTA